MSLEDRFELGEVLRDDGVRTLAAREKLSGQELLVHFFENPSEAPELLASLDRLPERERQRIVDRGDRAGTPYVVTGSLTGSQGFREWLKANAREPRSLEAAGAWKVILPEGSVDEQFLSLFQTGDRVQPAKPPETGAATSSAKEPAATEPVAKQPVATQPAAKEPGEFTRLFQAPATPVQQPALEKQAQQPGEFTRMFQAQPAAAPPPQRQEGAGEFTRFFETQKHESQARVPEVPPVQPILPSAKQGEFTKVFGRGELKSHLPLSPELPAVPPRPEEPASPPPSIIAPQPSSHAAAPKGPGDYTRQFSAAPVLTLGQGPAETPRQPLASSGRAATSRVVSTARWPLILGIAAVVVLVVVGIVFLASRSK